MSTLSAGEAPAYLEMRLRFVNGREARFVQPDPKEARHILEQIHPDRVFTERPVLSLGSQVSLSLVPAKAVERIDFYSDPVPDWPFHNGVRDVQEISEELFHVSEALPPYVLARFDLASGARLHLRLHIQPSGGPVTPLDASLFLTHMLSGPSLRGRMEGGVFLVNPAKILHVAIYPGPPETPTGAWNARLAEKRG